MTNSRTIRVWIMVARDNGEVMDVRTRPPIVDGVGRGEDDRLHHHYELREIPWQLPKAVRCDCIEATLEVPGTNP